MRAWSNQTSLSLKLWLTNLIGAWGWLSSWSLKPRTWFVFLIVEESFKWFGSFFFSWGCAGREDGEENQSAEGLLSASANIAVYSHLWSDLWLGHHPFYPGMDDGHFLCACTHTVSHLLPCHSLAWAYRSLESRDWGRRRGCQNCFGRRIEEMKEKVLIIIWEGRIGCQNLVLAEGFKRWKKSVKYLGSIGYARTVLEGGPKRWKKVLIFGKHFVLKIWSARYWNHSLYLHYYPCSKSLEEKLFEVDELLRCVPPLWVPLELLWYARLKLGLQFRDIFGLVDCFLQPSVQFFSEWMLKHPSSWEVDLSWDKGDQPACTDSKHIGNHKISPSTQRGSLPIRFHIKCHLSPQVNHTHPFIKAAKFYWFFMRDKDQMGLFCAFGSNAGFLPHHVGLCSQNSLLQGHYTTHNCLNPTSCMLNCYLLGNIAADHAFIHLIMLLLSTSNVSQILSHESGLSCLFHHCWDST